MEGTKRRKIRKALRTEKVEEEETKLEVREQETEQEEEREDSHHDDAEQVAEGGDGDGDDGTDEPKRKRKRKRKSKAADENANADESNAQSTSTSTPSADTSQFHNDRTVYVEGIPYTANEDNLREFFAACGTITSLRMPVYQDSGRPRGYAHVEFDSKSGADAALKLSGEYLQSRYLTIERSNAPRALARSSSSRPDASSQPPGCKTLFVKNLPYSVTEDAVRNAFMVFGKISSVRLAVWGHTQKLKGFGYVEFQAESSAAIAMKKAGEIRVEGRPVVCDFETGNPKGSYRTPNGQPWQKQQPPKGKPRK